MTRWIAGLVDAQVAAGRAQGLFADLPGHGKPLVLDDLAGLDAAERFEMLLFRSLGEVSTEVALIRSVRANRARLLLSAVGAERDALEATLRAQVADLGDALRERRRSHAKPTRERVGRLHTS